MRKRVSESSIKCIEVIVLLMVLLVPLNGRAQSSGDTGSGTNVTQFMRGVEMSGNWFISFRDGYEQIQADDENIPDEYIHSSEFILKRSYFTLKKKLNDTYSVRYTQDLTVDREGGDAGNVETRLKYLYVKAQPEINSEIITGFWTEVGMVHRPWLDYEQKINSYRVQDNMAIERARLFNSADFGVVIGGNIGPAMDREFLSKVNASMPGKYFTYVIGIYNGGGYSGAETNTNKVIDGRISVRPLAESVPEIQLSTYVNFGKGNSAASPDFNQWLGFIAYTGKHLTFTSQVHSGVGDFRAQYVDINDPSKALKNSGYSFFSEYKIPKTQFAVWGRYDHFELENKADDTLRWIGGLSYRINTNLRIVANTEHTYINDDIEDVYEINLEISF